MAGNLDRRKMLELVKSRVRHQEEEALDVSSATRISKAISAINDDERVSIFQQALTNICSSVQCEAAKSMHCAQGSLTTAVEQTLAYWTTRNNLFTSDAFNPMSITGSGCMSRSDLVVLKSGFFVALPRDQKGRPVLCYDRSRLEGDFDDISSILQHVKRCLFYMIQAVSEEDSTQSVGIVLLEIYHSSYRPLSADKEIAGFLDYLTDSVMPVKLARVDVIIKPPRVGKRAFMDNVYPDLLCNTQKRFPQGRLTVHVDNSKGKLLSALKTSGFFAEGLPSAIGGTWGYYKSFTTWIRDREVSEKVNESTQTSSGGDVPVDGLMAAVAIVRDDAAKQRKRELDVIYARRKRRRRKSEEDQLRETIDRLRDERIVLSRRNGSLNELWTRATRILSILGATEYSVLPQPVDPTNQQFFNDGFGPASQAVSLLDTYTTSFNQPIFPSIQLNQVPQPDPLLQRSLQSTCPSTAALLGILSHSANHPGYRRAEEYHTTPYTASTTEPQRHLQQVGIAHTPPLSLEAIQPILMNRQDQITTSMINQMNTTSPEVRGPLGIGVMPTDSSQKTSAKNNDILNTAINLRAEQNSSPSDIADTCQKEEKASVATGVREPGSGK